MRLEKGTVADRIIPARAGFTAYGDRKTTWGKDHPRSRGVYHAAARLIGGGGGSSPLARGLRRWRRGA